MMDLIAKRPKGTQDVLPSQSFKWREIERLVRDAADRFGFTEIRLPTFEETGLFVRSVGDTTDVVQKEMYSVTAKGDAEFTLRPEGTAGAMRALLENGVLNEGIPQKLFYVQSCFRHEQPQSGRLREFHQFGCELVGTASPCADAEIIAMAKYVLAQAGIKNVELYINSIGCRTCRAEYHRALKDYFGKRREELCETCQGRLEKNPMRILDCKSEVCSEIAKDAPVITDYLCDDCREHFESVKRFLGAMNVSFKVDPGIVRGLDYYTRTVFEFVSTEIGAQGTVCGGGRYDGLIESLGGAPTPALGFGAGIERMMLLMEKQGFKYEQPETCDLYIAAADDRSRIEAVKLVCRLREDLCDCRVEYDLASRGLKAQMKYANKIGAKFCLVLGGEELESATARLRCMSTGEETGISLGEGFSEEFAGALMSYRIYSTRQRNENRDENNS